MHQAMDESHRKLALLVDWFAYFVAQLSRGASAMVTNWWLPPEGVPSTSFSGQAVVRHLLNAGVALESAKGRGKLWPFGARCLSTGGDSKSWVALETPSRILYFGYLELGKL